MGDVKQTDELSDEVVEGEAIEEQVDSETQAQAEIVVREREHPLPAASSLPNPIEWEATMAVARQIANTAFVPTAYRGQPESVVAAILFGREIGIGPMRALQKIHMVDGKPSLAADEMLAQMRRNGLVIVDSESTRERAWIKARRTDTGEEAEVEWTIEEARQIPARERSVNIMLAEKGTWQAYPADMLWARCVGRLARRLGSDLVGGVVYSAEEMQDWDRDDDTGSYGTGSGYSASTQQRKAKAATTTDGIEMRADAPRGGWPGISKALETIDAGLDWKAWISQAVYVHSRGEQTTVKALDEQGRVDVGIRVANGIAHLLAALAGRDFPPPTRAEIQAAFAHPDSLGVTLPGPEGPLDPTEAAALAHAALDSEAAEAAGAATGTTETGSEAPAGGTQRPKAQKPVERDNVDAEVDDIPFGDAP